MYDFRLGLRLRDLKPKGKTKMKKLVLSAMACVALATGARAAVAKDIPHVTGITVSNAVEKVKGESIGDITEYRVMLGDDVFVGYATSRSTSRRPLAMRLRAAGMSPT